MRVRGKPMNGNERSMARDFDRDAAPDLSKDGWPEKFARTAVRRGRPSVAKPKMELRFVEVGPAHTKGDVVVYVPEDKTLFTGDILFVEGHPVVWTGPIGN